MTGKSYSEVGVCPDCLDLFPLRGGKVIHHRCKAVQDGETVQIWNGNLVPIEVRSVPSPTLNQREV